MNTDFHHSINDSFDNNSKDNSPTIFLADSVETMEHLIHQTSRYRGKTIERTTKDYSYNDIISAQAYLKLLNDLEESIYRNNIVNLRSFLRGYLYNNFDFRICVLEDSKLKLQSDLLLSEVKDYGKSSDYICFDKSVSDPKTVRNYFNKYLTSHCAPSAQINCKYPCYASKSSFSPEEAKYHYYLPYSQLPEFLLTFSFNDGRVFSENPSQSKRIMRFSQKRCRTEKSYQARMKDFFAVNSVLKNRASATVHYYRLSNLFLWNRCACLFSYYKTYTSDIFLEKIVESFELTYHQVINLKSTIIDTIFKDKYFIAQCLCSNCLDPFYLFDISFQSKLLGFHFPLFNNPDNVSLPELLQQLKQMTHQYLDNAPNEISKIDSFRSTIAEKCDTAPKAQSYILEELQKNAFFQSYYPYSYDEFHSSIIEFFKNILPYDFLLDYLPH